MDALPCLPVLLSEPGIEPIRQPPSSKSGASRFSVKMNAQVFLLGAAVTLKVADPHRAPAVPHMAGLHSETTLDAAIGVHVGAAPAAGTQTFPARALYGRETRVPGRRRLALVASARGRPPPKSLSSKRRSSPLIKGG